MMLLLDRIRPRSVRRWAYGWALLLAFGLSWISSACAASGTAGTLAAPTRAINPPAQETLIPDERAVLISPASTAGTPTHTAITQGATLSPGSFPTESIPPSPSPSVSPTSSPLAVIQACRSDLCTYSLPDFLRPIQPPGNSKMDHSYRFGATQGKTRDPHHGIEFLNPHGTPVTAVARGVVVVAGDDREVFHGPYSYFYGNLVIIQHDLPGFARPVYTLYGHLSQIDVETGQAVDAGQQIGLVGMSGVATGSHLHFEVRYGENSYPASSNPEIWLSTLGEDGTRSGSLAGRILDANGAYLQVENIVLERLPGPGQPGDGEIYLQTYEEKALIGQLPYEESFAAGDLEPGWYRINFVQYGAQKREVEIRPGELTLVTFRLGD